MTPISSSAHHWQPDLRIRHSSEILYLSGRLFAEPEIGQTANSEWPVKILLLTEPGLYQIEPTVLPIYCQAATQAHHLNHGDRVVVQGRLCGTTSRTPDGSIRRGVQIRADEFIIPRRSTRAAKN